MCRFDERLKPKGEESTCLAYTGLPIGKWAGLLIGIYFLFLFYYESRKRELKTRLIYEGRCDEGLKDRVKLRNLHTSHTLGCVIPGVIHT